MKYLHIMPDHFYSKAVIELIKSDLNFHEHEFIIFENNKKKYITEKWNNIKKYKSSVFIFSLTFIKQFISLRKVMKRADFIFIHNLEDGICRYLFLFKGKAKRLWVIWGADLYNFIPLILYDQFTSELLTKLKYIKNNLLFKIIYILNYKIRRSAIKQLDYLISLLKGDVLLLKKWFKTDSKHLEFIYPNPVDFEKLDTKIEKIDNTFNFKKSNYKLLLIGNSGAPTNNHLDILIRLSRIKKQNFIIICPLSYGPPNYISKIVEKGNMLFGNRFIPLLEFLDPDIYYEILKQIDIAIMYHNRQQGVGTINTLLYLGKKICLKKTSVFFFFTKRGLSLFSINDLEGLILGKIKYSEEMAQKNKKFASQFLTVKTSSSLIKNLFKFLERST